MNAKILASALIILVIVSSCNRRYSSRQYVKGERNAVSVIVSPNEEDKTEPTEDLAGENEFSYQEEDIQETDNVEGFAEPSEVLNKNAEKRKEFRLVRNAERLFSKDIKSDQNLHPEDARPDDNSNKSNKGLAIASFILGLLSLIFLLIFPLFALVLAIMAVIFGAISIKDEEGRGFAIAGLVAGLVTLAIFLFVFLLILAIIL